ncbi:MAG: glycosyltransferase family 2 protein [Pirellulales bacterium]|nr:glycosyltransferase family 2 protein [Pirellulales bacterium]
MTHSNPSPPAPGRDALRPVVSVVLSFWNEEDVLPELVRRLRAVFAALRDANQIAGHELVFVNDASTDQSEALLYRLAEGHDDLRVVNMSRNFGVSPCVLAGMAHATGDVVVYMDADLQDPPEVIPELLRAWREDPHVEVVHTVRQSRAGETRLKLAITAIGYRLLKSVSSIDLPLEAGDFKLLTRRAVDQVLQFEEKRPFLRGLVCWIGFKQAKVHYHREARAAGATKFPVLGVKVIRNFIDSAVVAFSDVPLKFSTAMGLGCSLLSLASLIWIAVAWLLGHSISGQAAILTAIFFIGGVQLLSIGILGNYLGSIFLETKRRPNYIVRDTFGFNGARPPTVPAHVDAQAP